MTSQPREPDYMSHSRMSFGDHLEELRRRIIWALVGVVVATVICFAFGDRLIFVLTKPYTDAMRLLGSEPQLVQLHPAESFLEYFKVCLKFGLLISAPWAIYQIWQFVATGLYSHERRLIRWLAPTSIGLFVVGAVFLVTIVLKGLLLFLINVSTWFPMPGLGEGWWPGGDKQAVATTMPSTAPLAPVLDGDPPDPQEGQIWINQHDSTLNAFFGGRRWSARLEQADRQRYVQPLFDVREYLGFVVNLALAFGLGFQIPIIVVFIITVRIVAASDLARSRKYIILAVAVLAAILTPSPDVGTMLLLGVPMVLLFEAGLLIGRTIDRRRTQRDAAAQ